MNAALNIITGTLRAKICLLANIKLFGQQPSWLQLDHKDLDVSFVLNWRWLYFDIFHPPFVPRFGCLGQVLKSMTIHSDIAFNAVFPYISSRNECQSFHDWYEKIRKRAREFGRLTSDDSSCCRLLESGIEDLGNTNQTRGTKGGSRIMTDRQQKIEIDGLTKILWSSCKQIGYGSQALRRSAIQGHKNLD